MTARNESAHQAPNNRVTSLRVIVADDHPLYRESIIRTLRTAGETVVAEAADGASALALIRQHEPDVALVDVRMPGLDGIDLVGALSRHGPDVPVVLLSAFNDGPLVRAGLHAGAAAYITKDADREVILQAVRTAVDPTHAPHALSGGGDLLSTPRNIWFPRLTGEEHRMLTLASAGVDKQEMARRTGLDEAQVRHALASAIDKLGADTLPEALGIAERAGILAEHT
jgi:two-component system nitrate/nitrite response regulator NarL